MTGRYDISYNSKIQGLDKNLAELGVGIAFNNQASGRMIASIPEKSLEQVKGLAGILTITESPLPSENSQK